MRPYIEVGAAPLRTMGPIVVATFTTIAVLLVSLLILELMQYNKIPVL